MTSRPVTATAPRLYVLTPPVGEAVEGVAGSLAETLPEVDVAAVLLRLPAIDERGMINLAKELALTVQGAGAALLLDGCADIVARAGADGAHLAGPDALKAALPRLKPNLYRGRRCPGQPPRRDDLRRGRRRLCDVR